MPSFSTLWGRVGGAGALLFALLLARTAVAQAQTVLRAGDIVITGVNATDPDEFSFAPLVDLAAGTQVQFTDNGW